MTADEVKVYFEDDTTTIIYVTEDELILERLGELAEEEGVAVVDYAILDQ